MNRRRPDRRVGWAAFVAAGVMVLLAQPALAAPAEGRSERKTVVDFGDPAYWDEVSELVSTECGYTVEAEVRGWVQTIEFRQQTGARSQLTLDVYHSDILFRNPEIGETFHLLDTGPDHVYERGGKLYMSLTGRSVTGSGVIGHVVVDLETGEVVFRAGDDQGSFLEAVCSSLAM